MNKIQGIYCIEHIDSNKKYYGSSMDINKRFGSHRSNLKYNRHHCIYLQRAVNKYGIDAFKFYVVEETSFQSNNELYELEQKYIDNNSDVYNMGSAGGGDNISNHPNREDIIKRIKETRKSKIDSMTEEERKDKWGQSGELNGRWDNGGKSSKICGICNKVRISATANTCNKCRPRTGSNNSFYGKTHSEETLSILRKNESWAKGLKPEDQSYTKKYEITYPDGSTKLVYGMKAIATEFNSSIANVDYTIDRMKRNSMPTKRSRFYNHIIKELAV
jgi:group I intron endonuclease